MSTTDGLSGVSNCYVFKSRLQEYAQKVGLATPGYETIKEGPSHEPSFRSTVIVNDVRYDSLTGFFNRKAAEQSAAEVALMELAKSGNMNGCISQPVHETGLCKNLLQEYAQKMNYAIPTYECQKDEKPGRVLLFSYTVEIGGIRYIGAAAKTKKEAEIRAARTALLAIESSASGFHEKSVGNSKLTVIPSRKKGTESGTNPEETAKALKPKKARFKKKSLKKRLPGDMGDHTQVKNMGILEVNVDGQGESEVDQTDGSMVEVADSRILAIEAMRNVQGGQSNTHRNEGEISVAKGDLVPHINGCSNAQLTASNFKQNDLETSNLEISSMVHTEDLATLVKEINKVSGVGQGASMVNNAVMGPREASSVMVGLKQIEDISNWNSNQG